MNAIAALFLNVVVTSFAANARLNKDDYEPYLKMSLFTAVVAMLLVMYTKMPYSIKAATVVFTILNGVLNAYVLFSTPKNIDELLVGSAVVSAFAYVPLMYYFMKTYKTKKQPSLDFPPAPTRPAPKSKRREALNRPLPPVPLAPANVKPPTPIAKQDINKYY